MKISSYLVKRKKTIAYRKTEKIIKSLWKRYLRVLNNYKHNLITEGLDPVDALESFDFKLIVDMCHKIKEVSLQDDNLDFNLNAIEFKKITENELNSIEDLMDLLDVFSKNIQRNISNGNHPYVIFSLTSYELILLLIPLGIPLMNLCIFWVEKIAY